MNKSDPGQGSDFQAENRYSLSVILQLPGV